MHLLEKTVFSYLPHDMKPLKEKKIMKKKKERQKTLECSTKLTWEAAAAGSKETLQEQHSRVSGRNQSEEAVLHLAALAAFVFCAACVPFLGLGHLGTASSSNASTRRQKWWWW